MPRKRQAILTDGCSIGDSGGIATTIRNYLLGKTKVPAQTLAFVDSFIKSSKSNACVNIVRLPSVLRGHCTRDNPSKAPHRCCPGRVDTALR